MAICIYLKIWVDLDFLAESGSFDFNERCRNCLTIRCWKHIKSFYAVDQIKVIHSKRITFIYARLLLKVTRPEPKWKTLQELCRRPQNLIQIITSFFITYGVLILVGVQACVDNTTKQILTQSFNWHDHVNQKCKEMVWTWKIMASPCAVIIPWRAPTKTVFWGSSLGAAHFT